MCQELLGQLQNTVGSKGVVRVGLPREPVVIHHERQLSRRSVDLGVPDSGP